MKQWYKIPMKTHPLFVIILHSNMGFLMLMFSFWFSFWFRPKGFLPPNEEPIDLTARIEAEGEEQFQPLGL